MELLTRRIIIGVLAVVLSQVFAPGAVAEEKAQETIYLPSLVLVGLACGPEEHALVPDEPLPDDILANPVDWVLSGEPECAAADAMNALREENGESRAHFGVGSARHVYASEDVDTLATAWATDAAFGEDAGHIRIAVFTPEGPIAVEGCGKQSMVLPEYIPHYQGGVWVPPEWWAFVTEAGVDEDLTPCFATTGVVHGTWGA